MTPHDKTIAVLIKRGLIDGETHAITPAGHEYVRALIARCNAHNKPNSYLAKDKP